MTATTGWRRQLLGVKLCWAIAWDVQRGISEGVAIQLKQLFGGCKEPLEVELVPCPLQPNTNDCGVFAIAVAFDWALGHVVGGDCDHVAMHGHLPKCLETNEVLPFPRAHIGAAKRGRKKKNVVVNV